MPTQSIRLTRRRTQSAAKSTTPAIAGSSYGQIERHRPLQHRHNPHRSASRVGTQPRNGVRWPGRESSPAAWPSIEPDVRHDQVSPLQTKKTDDVLNILWREG